MTLSLAPFFAFLLYKTNRFHDAMRLFSKITEDVKLWHGKNIGDTLVSGHFFLPHVDVICDLLLKRLAVTLNLFVNYTCGRSFLSENNKIKKIIRFIYTLFYKNVVFPA